MAKSKEENKTNGEFKPKKMISLREKRKSLLGQYHVMTKSRAKLTLKMLNPKNNLKPKPQKNSCITSADNVNNFSCMWDSNTFILQNIRSCILTNNWNCLTKLLLLLFHRTGKGSYLIKQITKLNLMKNPADSNGELLSRFLDNIKMLEKIIRRK